jgi:ferritin
MKKVLFKDILAMRAGNRAEWLSQYFRGSYLKKGGDDWFFSADFHDAQNFIKECVEIYNQHNNEMSGYLNEVEGKPIYEKILESIQKQNELIAELVNELKKN